MPSEMYINNELPAMLLPPVVQEALSSPSVKNTLYEIKNAADTVAEKSKQFFNDLETNLVNAPVDDLIAKVRKIGTTTEKVFNILGCIPFIGSSSGSLRMALGHLQVLGGAALAAIGEIGVFVSKMHPSENGLEQKWKKVSLLGAELILHGCLNSIRGYGEVLLGHYSLGLANVILLMPNVYKKDAFSPYFAYGALKC